VPRRVSKAKANPSPITSPTLQVSTPSVDPTTSHICVHFHTHVLTVTIAIAFLSRRQLACRYPTNNPPSASARGDRSTTMRTKPTSTPSDDSRTQQMQRQAIRQGFCYVGSTTGAHGLLAKKNLPPLPNLLPHSLTAVLAPPHLLPTLVWILTSILMFRWASRTRTRMQMG
jgi:hypothetical protein